MHHSLNLKKFKLHTFTILACLVIAFSSVNLSLAATPPSSSTTTATEAVTTEGQAEEKASTEEHSEEETKDTGIVGMFGLNWKLFVAQLVNFSIVLFVLWKWVFTPLTKGLSERTAKIEESLKLAETTTKERETFEEWKNNEMMIARKEAGEIITKAKNDTEAIKQKILDDTKQEQAKLTSQAQAKMLQDKDTMVQEAKAEIADMVIAATESIIKQTLDKTADKKLIDSALNSIKEK